MYVYECTYVFTNIQRVSFVVCSSFVRSSFVVRCAKAFRVSCSVFRVPFSFVCFVVVCIVRLLCCSAFAVWPSWLFDLCCSAFVVRPSAMAFDGIGSYLFVLVVAAVRSTHVSFSQCRCLSPLGRPSLLFISVALL